MGVGSFACSYEFGAAGFGGEGGTLGAGSGVYTSDVSTSAAGVTGPAGGPATSAPSTVASVGVSSVEVSSASTGAPQAVCGNGAVEEGEDCEPGGPFGDACEVSSCKVECAGGRFSKDAGLCYFYGGGATDRDDATTKCLEWKSTAALAILDTPARHAGAASVTPGGGTPFLGLSKESGSWKWRDGSNAEVGSPYTDWAVSCSIVDFIFGTGGNCGVMIDILEDKWCSADCSTDNGFVCEWAPQ